jgi:hypothetical protein
MPSYNKTIIKYLVYKKLTYKKLIYFFQILARNSFYLASLIFAIIKECNTPYELIKTANRH